MTATPVTTTTPTKWTATTSLVLGIITFLPTLFIYTIPGILLAVAGLTLGIVAATQHATTWKWIVGIALNAVVIASTLMFGI